MRAVTIVLKRQRHRLVRWWSQLWSTPDPFFIGQGAKGELKIVWIRIAVASGLFLIPFRELPPGASGGFRWGRLLAVAVAVAIGIAVRRITTRNRYRPFVGFATSALDVTMITAGLVALLVVDHPLAAVNSRVLFSVYFVAIGATTLRHDPRICALAGLLAVAQYATLVSFADTRWLLHRPEFLFQADGSFDLSSHYARLALLFSATVVAASAARQARHLRELSARDPLTGVLNRGFFDELADAEVRRTVRYDRSMTVALSDVDHFKHFNDRYGHLVGDEVLRGIGTMMSKVRQSDLVARYGGEEFILLFPETSAAAVLPKVERLWKRIQASGVTISIGLASIPEDGTDLRSLIDQADRRLYEAKDGGRNRIVGPGGILVAGEPATVPGTDA